MLPLLEERVSNSKSPAYMRNKAISCGIVHALGNAKHSCSPELLSACGSSPAAHTSGFGGGFFASPVGLHSLSESSESTASCSSISSVDTSSYVSIQSPAVSPSSPPVCASVKSRQALGGGRAESSHVGVAAVLDAAVSPLIAEGLELQSPVHAPVAEFPLSTHAIDTPVVELVACRNLCVSDRFHRAEQRTPERNAYNLSDDVGPRQCFPDAKGPYHYNATTGGETAADSAGGFQKSCEAVACCSLRFPASSPQTCFFRLRCMVGAAAAGAGTCVQQKFYPLAAGAAIPVEAAIEQYTEAALFRKPADGKKERELIGVAAVRAAGAVQLAEDTSTTTAEDWRRGATGRDANGTGPDPFRAPSEERPFSAGGAACAREEAACRKDGVAAAQQHQTLEKQATSCQPRETVLAGQGGAAVVAAPAVTSPFQRRDGCGDDSSATRRMVESATAASVAQCAGKRRLGEEQELPPAVAAGSNSSIMMHREVGFPVWEASEQEDKEYRQSSTFRKEGPTSSLVVTTAAAHSSACSSLTASNGICTAAPVSSGLVPSKSSLLCLPDFSFPPGDLRSPLAVFSGRTAAVGQDWLDDSRSSRSTRCFSVACGDALGVSGGMREAHPSKWLLLCAAAVEIGDDNEAQFCEKLPVSSLSLAHSPLSARGLDGNHNAGAAEALLFFHVPSETFPGGTTPATTEPPGTSRTPVSGSNLAAAETVAAPPEAVATVGGESLVAAPGGAVTEAVRDVAESCVLGQHLRSGTACVRGARQEALSASFQRVLTTATEPIIQGERVMLNASSTDDQRRRADGTLLKLSCGALRQSSSSTVLFEGAQQQSASSHVLERADSRSLERETQEAEEKDHRPSSVVVADAPEQQIAADSHQHIAIEDKQQLTPDRQRQTGDTQEQTDRTQQTDTQQPRAWHTTWQDSVGVVAGEGGRVIEEAEEKQTGGSSSALVEETEKILERVRPEVEDTLFCFAKDQPQAWGSWSASRRQLITEEETPRYRQEEGELQQGNGKTEEASVRSTSIGEVYDSYADTPSPLCPSTVAMTLLPHSRSSESSSQASSDLFEERQHLEQQTERELRHGADERQQQREEGRQADNRKSCTAGGADNLWRCEEENAVHADAAALVAPCAAVVSPSPHGGLMNMAGSGIRVGGTQEEELLEEAFSNSGSAAESRGRGRARVAGIRQQHLPDSRGQRGKTTLKRGRSDMRRHQRRLHGGDSGTAGVTTKGGALEGSGTTRGGWITAGGPIVAGGGRFVIPTRPLYAEDAAAEERQEDTGTIGSGGVVGSAETVVLAEKSSSSQSQGVGASGSKKRRRSRHHASLAAARGGAGHALTTGGGDELPLDTSEAAWPAAFQQGLMQQHRHQQHRSQQPHVVELAGLSCSNISRGINAGTASQEREDLCTSRNVPPWVVQQQHQLLVAQQWHPRQQQQQQVQQTRGMNDTQFCGGSTGSFFPKQHLPQQLQQPVQGGGWHVREQAPPLLPEGHRIEAPVGRADVKAVRGGSSAARGRRGLGRRDRYISKYGDTTAAVGSDDDARRRPGTSARGGPPSLRLTAAVLLQLEGKMLMRGRVHCGVVRKSGRGPLQPPDLRHVPAATGVYPWRDGSGAARGSSKPPAAAPEGASAATVARGAAAGGEDARTANEAAAGGELAAAGDRTAAAGDGVAAGGGTAAASDGVAEADYPCSAASILELRDARAVEEVGVGAEVALDSVVAAAGEREGVVAAAGRIIRAGDAGKEGGKTEIEILPSLGGERADATGAEFGDTGETGKDTGTLGGGRVEKQLQVGEEEQHRLEQQQEECTWKALLQQQLKEEEKEGRDPDSTFFWMVKERAEKLRVRTSGVVEDRGGRTAGAGVGGGEGQQQHRKVRPAAFERAEGRVAKERGDALNNNKTGRSGATERMLMMCTGRNAVAGEPPVDTGAVSSGSDVSSEESTKGTVNHRCRGENAQINMCANPSDMWYGLTTSDGKPVVLPTRPSRWRNSSSSRRQRRLFREQQQRKLQRGRLALHFPSQQFQFPQQQFPQRQQIAHQHPQTQVLQHHSHYQQSSHAPQHYGVRGAPGGSGERGSVVSSWGGSSSALQHAAVAAAGSRGHVLPPAALGSSERTQTFVAAASGAAGERRHPHAVGADRGETAFVPGLRRQPVGGHTAAAAAPGAQNAGPLQQHTPYQQQTSCYWAAAAAGSSGGRPDGGAAAASGSMASQLRLQPGRTAALHTTQQQQQQQPPPQLFRPGGSGGGKPAGHPHSKRRHHYHEQKKKRDRSSSSSFPAPGAQQQDLARPPAANAATSCTAGVVVAPVAAASSMPRPEEASASCSVAAAVLQLPQQQQHSQQQHWQQQASRHRRRGQPHHHHSRRHGGTASSSSSSSSKSRRRGTDRVVYVCAKAAASEAVASDGASLAEAALVEEGLQNRSDTRGSFAAASALRQDNGRGVVSGATHSGDDVAPSVATVVPHEPACCPEGSSLSTTSVMSSPPVSTCPGATHLDLATSAAAPAAGAGPPPGASNKKAAAHSGGREAVGGTPSGTGELRGGKQRYRDEPSSQRAPRRARLDESGAFRPVMMTSSSAVVGNYDASAVPSRQPDTQDGFMPREATVRASHATVRPAQEADGGFKVPRPLPFLKALRKGTAGGDASSMKSIASSKAGFSMAVRPSAGGATVGRETAGASSTNCGTGGMMTESRAIPTSFKKQCEASVGGVEITATAEGPPFAFPETSSKSQLTSVSGASSGSLSDVAPGVIGNSNYSTCGSSDVDLSGDGSMNSNMRRLDSSISLHGGGGPVDNRPVPSYRDLYCHGHQNSSSSFIPETALPYVPTAMQQLPAGGMDAAAIRGIEIPSVKNSGNWNRGSETLEDSEVTERRDNTAPPSQAAASPSEFAFPETQTEVMGAASASSSCRSLSVATTITHTGPTNSAGASDLAGGTVNLADMLEEAGVSTSRSRAGATGHPPVATAGGELPDALSAGPPCFPSSSSAAGVQVGVVVERGTVGMPSSAVYYDTPFRHNTVRRGGVVGGKSSSGSKKKKNVSRKKSRSGSSNSNTDVWWISAREHVQWQLAKSRGML